MQENLLHERASLTHDPFHHDRTLEGRGERIGELLRRDLHPWTTDLEERPIELQVQGAPPSHALGDERPHLRVELLRLIGVGRHQAPGMANRQRLERLGKELEEHQHALQRVIDELSGTIEQSARESLVLFEVAAHELPGEVRFASEGRSALLLITFCAMFQHANIRTPRWLGYLIQRPESHTLHHARDVHGYNYADLPLVEMLFGTFRNPRGFEHDTGFYEGASARVMDLVLCRDVSSRAAMEEARVRTPGLHGPQPSPSRS